MAMRSATRAWAHLAEAITPATTLRVTPWILARGTCLYSTSETPGTTDAPSTAPESEPAPETSAVPELDPYAALDPQFKYSKTQLAHYAPDPEKHNRFLPRMSRKDRGSFADPKAEVEFFEETERYPRVPEGVPLYNLRDVVPEIYQSRSELHERIKATRLAMPGASVVQVLQALGLAHPSPPAPAQDPILEWESSLVLVTGVTESHPANWKVRCRVYLRDLQRKEGLSEAALQHLARIAGPRYDPTKGRLLLTCDRHADREGNRREVLGMLRALVAEGHRAFPAEQAAQAVAA